MMSKGEQADDDERSSNCCVSSNIIQSAKGKIKMAEATSPPNVK